MTSVQAWWRRRARSRLPPAPGASLLAALLAALLLAFLGGGVAHAHATLVLGTIAFEPDPPPVGHETTVRIRLHDPSLLEVEDAIVFVQFSPYLDGNVGHPLVSTERLDEIEPAVYETRIVAPPAGDYRLRVIDRTFRQEEAVADVDISIGSGTVGNVAFVLPPTATGPQDVLSWLVWIVGLPLLAGVIVTVLVLRGGSKDPSDGTIAETDANG